MPEEGDECTNRRLVVEGRVHGDAAATTGLRAQEWVTSTGQLGHRHGGGGRVGDQRRSQVGLEVHVAVYRHYW